MVGQVRSGIGLTRLGEEKCGKNRRQNEAITAISGADGRSSGVLPMKIVSQCREQARCAYNGAVFEIKKEIPG